MSEGDAERRDDERAAITLRVDYKRQNTFFVDYTKNISKGGTFIRTTKPLDVGTQFVFVLSVPEAGGDEALCLELTGEVKWVVQESAATPDNPAGMGIQFVFQDPAERQRIEQRAFELMKVSLGEHLATKLLSRA
jgi:type IV pilus assembly protein PilZ